MYELNKQSAENGSGNTGTLINEGKHDVTIEQAYEVLASTGAKGVHIDFKNKQGLSRSIVFYVQNAQGEPIFGMDQLNAILAVTKVKAVNTQKSVVTYYDYESRKDLQKEAMVLVELVGKQLGIIIHKEANHYDGRVTARYGMTAPLVINTDQTALEVLNGQEAKTWESLLTSALARSEKAEQEIQNHTPAPASAVTGTDYGQTSGGQLDDDIPFATHLKGTIA